MGCTSSVIGGTSAVDTSRLRIVDDLSTSLLTTGCSRLLLDRLNANPGIPKRGFCSLEHDAVVLVVDISGFTALGQRLSALGKHGAESLSSTISSYFGPLVDRLIEYGASVESFGGDAIFALFGSQFGSPNQRLTQAAACALSIVETLGEFHTVIPIVNVTHTLTSHLGIAFGSFATLHVGGHATHYRRIVCGGSMKELDEALTIAGSREVAATRAAAAHLSSICELIYDSNGFARLVGWRANATAPVGSGGYPDALAFADALDAQGAADPHVKNVKRSIAAFLDAQKVVQEADMTAFVPESRRATILFVGMGIHPSQAVATESAAKAILSVLQEMVSGVQAVLARYDGRLSNCLADEKGFNLVLSFGFPAHEDDPLRGVLAGLLIHRNLTKTHAAAVKRGVLTVDATRFPTIGITTGTVMSGRVGSQLRSEEALLGSPVNLAARLMTYARLHPLKGGALASSSSFKLDRQQVPAVLMDVDTQRAMEQYPAAPPSKPVGRIVLKGFSDLVMVFAPDLSADFDDMTSAAFASFLPQPGLIRAPRALMPLELPRGSVQVGHFVWPPTASRGTVSVELTPRGASMSSPTIVSTGPSFISNLSEVQQTSLHNIGSPLLSPSLATMRGMQTPRDHSGPSSDEATEVLDMERSTVVDTAGLGAGYGALAYDSSQNVEVEFFPVLGGKLFARAQLVEEFLLALKGMKGPISFAEIICAVQPDTSVRTVSTSQPPSPSAGRRGPAHPFPSTSLAPPMTSYSPPAEVMYTRCATTSLSSFLAVAHHPTVGVPLLSRGKGAFSGHDLVKWTAAALRTELNYVVSPLQVLVSLHMIAYAPGSKEIPSGKLVILPSSNISYIWTSDAYACAKRSSAAVTVFPGATAASLLSRERLSRKPAFTATSLVQHNHSAAAALFGASLDDPCETCVGDDPTTPGVSMYVLAGNGGCGKTYVLDMVLAEALHRFQNGNGAGGFLRSSRWFTWFQILHAGTSAVGPYPVSRSLLGQAIHRLVCLNNGIDHIDTESLPASLSYELIRTTVKDVLAARIPHLCEAPCLQALINEVLEMNIFDVPPVTSGLLTLQNMQPCFALGMILSGFILELAERVRPIVIVIDNLHTIATRPLDGTAVEVLKASLQQYRNSGVLILAAARAYKTHSHNCMLPSVAVVPVPPLEKDFIRGLLRDVMSPLRIQAAENVVEWFLNTVTADTSPRVVVHAIRTVTARVAKFDVAPLQVVRRRLIMPSNVNASELTALAAKLHPGVQDAFSQEVLSKLDRISPRIVVVMKAASTFISSFSPLLLEYVIRFALQSAAFPLRYEVNGTPKDPATVPTGYPPKLLADSAIPDAPLDAIISHLVAQKWLLVEAGTILSVADHQEAVVVAGSLLASQRRIATVITCRVLQRLAVACSVRSRYHAAFAWQLSPFCLEDVHRYTLPDAPHVKLQAEMTGAAAVDDKGFARDFSRSVVSAWSPVVAALPGRDARLPRLQAADGSISVERNYPRHEFAPLLICVTPDMWVIADEFVVGLFERSIEKILPYGFLASASSTGNTPFAEFHVPRFRVINGALVSDAIRLVHFGYLTSGYFYACNHRNKAPGPLLISLSALLALDWDDFENQFLAGTLTNIGPDPNDPILAAEQSLTPECDVFTEGNYFQFAHPPTNPTLRSAVDAARLQLLTFICVAFIRLAVVPSDALYIVACETMSSALALNDSFAARVGFGAAHMAFANSAIANREKAQHLTRMYISMLNAFRDEATVISAGYFMANLATRYGRMDIAYAVNEIGIYHYLRKRDEFDLPCLDDLFDQSTMLSKFMLQKQRFAYLVGYYNATRDTLIEHAALGIPSAATPQSLVVATRVLGNLLLSGQWRALRILAAGVSSQATKLAHPLGIRGSAFAHCLVDLYEVVGIRFECRVLLNAIRDVLANQAVVVHDNESESDFECDDIMMGQTNTLGIAAGRALVRLSDAFTDFQSQSSDIHRVAYYTALLRTLPMAWLPIGGSLIEAPADVPRASINVFDLLRNAPERRTSAEVMRRQELAQLMNARLLFLERLCASLNPETFGSVNEVRQFMAMTQITLYMLRHATNDHPRSATLYGNSARKGEVALQSIDMHSGEVALPAISGGSFSGFDPALSLFEYTIAKDPLNDEPLISLLHAGTYTPIATESYGTVWNGPPNSAGAVAAQAMLLLSEVIRSGLPISDLSTEKLLGVGPFPILGEWRMPTNVQHHAVEALRDYLVLLHPKHPMAPAVSSVLMASDKVTPEQLRLLPTSPNPATAINSLLQLSGNERIMSKNGAIALAQRWLRENGDDDDSLVGQHLSTLRWCVQIHRGAAGAY